jgi:hypothetical protein
MPQSVEVLPIGVDSQGDGRVLEAIVVQQHGVPVIDMNVLPQVRPPREAAPSPAREEGIHGGRRSYGLDVPGP